MSCGGTISGLRKDDNAVKASDGLLLIKERLSSRLSLKFINVLNALSEDMDHKHWITIAQSIKKEVLGNQYKAIIGLHSGTYTLAYMASALSFMLQNLPIPVLITGSVYTLHDKNSDVIKNLNMSLIAIKYMAKYPGVYVIFPKIKERVYDYFCGVNSTASDNKKNTAYCIYRGVNLRKIHSWNVRCFQSINSPAFAEINKEKFIINDVSMKKNVPSLSRFSVKTKINPRVCFIKVFPSMKSQLLIDLSNHYRAFILEGYVDGTLSTSKACNFLKAVKVLLDKKIPVFVTSQPAGRTTLSAYEGGVKLRLVGVIPLGNMTSETAIVKLMWVLGMTRDFSEINRLMLRNIVGEVSGMIPA
jgi:L-asparaginase type I